MDGDATGLEQGGLIGELPGPVRREPHPGRRGARRGAHPAASGRSRAPSGPPSRATRPSPTRLRVSATGTTGIAAPWRSRPPPRPSTRRPRRGAGRRRGRGPAGRLRPDRAPARCRTPAATDSWRAPRRPRRRRRRPAATGRRERLDPPGRRDEDHPLDRAARPPTRRASRRAAADRRPGRQLVDAAHPARRAGGDDDDVGRRALAPDPVATSVERGWAKIIRPATVWRTRVTVTSSSRSMSRAPPSTTIIVPSSRKPTPWPASLPSWMTRTRSSSPGQHRGLHRVGERVDVHHPDALELGDAVEVEVVGQDDPAAPLRQRDQLRVDLGDAGRLVVDDLDRRLRVLLHPVEDLEAAPAAVAPQGVGPSAMCWSSSSTNRGTTSARR